MLAAHQLWQTLIKNLAISVLLFTCLLGILWLIEIFFPTLHLLKWDNAAWCVGIPASIVGVAYVLTIRDPKNYTGFYAGIVMSAMLGVQFLLQHQYDSTLLYWLIFPAFQILSIISWQKGKTDNKSSSSTPEFLSMKMMLISLLVFIAVTIADYAIVTLIVEKNGFGENIWTKLLNALLISSSVLANFWLIYRKTDAWVYWIIYSIAGVALFILIGNIFSVVLFVFFLVKRVYFFY